MGHDQAALVQGGVVGLGATAVVVGLLWLDLQVTAHLRRLVVGGVGAASGVAGSVRQAHCVPAAAVRLLAVGHRATAVLLVPRELRLYYPLAAYLDLRVKRVAVDCGRGLPQVCLFIHQTIYFLYL